MSTQAQVDTLREEGEQGSDRVLASFSEKGGVGKSALVAGVAAAARKRGESVLVGDLDPRASLTEEMGLNPEAVEYTVNDLLNVDITKPAVDPRGLAADIITAASEAWGVDVLAAQRALAHRETDNTSTDQRLRLALQGVSRRYRRTVLDVPPRAGGKLVVAALAAATHVFIPATLDADGRKGAQQAMLTIGHVRASNNPDLVVIAIVPSIVPNPRTAIAKEIEGLLIEEFGDLYRKDLAIPRHAIRQTTRHAQVPVTAVTDKEAVSLTSAYGRLLDAWDAA